MKKKNNLTTKKSLADASDFLVVMLKYNYV